jgi:hypothetical protein
MVNALIVKLDRLSRDVHFLSGLKDAGIDFVAADNPNATRFTVHIPRSANGGDALAAARRVGSVWVAGDLRAAMAAPVSRWTA